MVCSCENQRETGNEIAKMRKKMTAWDQISKRGGGGGGIQIYMLILEFVLSNIVFPGDFWWRFTWEMMTSCTVY